MSSLFRKTHVESDTRAAFFALASLMMILLPTLLMVTNPEKLVSIPLSLSNGQTQFTPPHSGIVEKIMVRSNIEKFEIEVWVRKSDVLADSGNTEVKSWSVGTWQEVTERLTAIRQLDNEQEKITFRPKGSHSAQEVIRWMDSLQIGLGFSNVVLEHPE